MLKISMVILLYILQFGERILKLYLCLLSTEQTKDNLEGTLKTKTFFTVETELKYLNFIKACSGFFLCYVESCSFWVCEK